MSEIPTLFRFGVFELNLSATELRKHGVHIRLRGQPLQLLALLLERHGEIVTREEMRTRLWPADTFVEFEHSLNTAVKKLRAALGDSPENPRYIETIPRVGYRFVAPAEKAATPAVAAPVAPDAAAPAPVLVAEAALPLSGSSAWATPSGPEMLPTVRPALFQRWPAYLGVAMALLVALGGYLWWSGSRARPQPTSGSLMLAVLPFENLTGDPGQEYFSDGLTEEMIAQLGRMDPEHLRVIARSSVMHYKHTQAPLDQIGRDLGAQYVLEGSVRRDANTVRVAAQLIQLKDQTHLWSRQYDRELSSLLALQGEIAREITDEIQVIIGSGARPAVIPQPAMSAQQLGAYDLYLKGLFFWNKRTDPGFEQAIGYFQQAIAKDPNYAPAYAGLANSYTLLTGSSLTPASRFMANARAAAVRALELDPNLPEAHAALALIVQNYDYDWETAEKEYRRAIELNPNYATAHHWYAEHLGFRGRFEEAFQESERARQLDPFSLIIATDRGALLYFSRQYDRAIEQFRAVLEMDENFPRAHLIGRACVEKGMYAEALQDLESTPRTWGNGAWYWGSLAFIHGRAGRLEEARKALKKLEDLNRRQPLATAYFILAYNGVGDKDKTLSYLEKAHRDHWNELITLKVEPAYDWLRSDPRFQDLQRRVGL